MAVLYRNHLTFNVFKYGIPSYNYQAITENERNKQNCMYNYDIVIVYVSYIYLVQSPVIDVEMHFHISVENIF